MFTPITISAVIPADVNQVWECWNTPEHIVNWNFASDDWHCPRSENDLRVGGKFNATMAARDGSMSFDFEGVYDVVEPLTRIEYSLADERHIVVLFEEVDGGVKVTETFDAETENSIEMQRAGWQSILDNFAKYVSSVSVPK